METSSDIESSRTEMKMNEEGRSSTGLESKGDAVHLLDAAARKKKPLLNNYVLACALLASLSSALLGYDIGVMSGAVLFVEEDMKIKTFQKELLVGSLNLVSLLGGAFAGRLSDYVGRRGAMASAAALFLVGALSMSVAPTYGILLMGRLVTGVGVGAALLIAPLYTAELAPAGVRGALVSLTEVFINVGILLGYIASYALSGLPAGSAWRWMVGLGGIPAFFLGAGALFMPESPRWLVMHGRKQQALRVLLLTSSGDRADADARLAEIVGSVQGKSALLESGGKEQRLARKESGQQELQSAAPLKSTAARNRRSTGTEGIPEGASVERLGSQQSSVRKDPIVEQRKGEEIARLQRVGAQPAFSGEAVRAASQIPPDSEVGKSPGAPFSQLHEGTDAVARGEVEAAGGLEEMVTNHGAGGSGVWRDLMLHPTPVVKRMLLIGLGTNFFQQATGVDAIVYYAPAVFALAGIHTRAGVLASTIVVGAAKAGFVLVAVFLLDRGWGRRPLLLMSAIGCTASLLTLALGFVLLGGGIDGGRDASMAPALAPGSAVPGGTGFVRSLAPVLAVTATCAYMAFFSAGLGPVNWVLSSEIYPSRLRAQAMGLSTVVNRTVSGTVSLTFLSIAEAITAAGTFFLYALIGLASVAFFYYLVPETKGKSLEDIEKMLEQKEGLDDGASSGSIKQETWLGRVYLRFGELFARSYTEVGDAGENDSTNDSTDEGTPARKKDSDTRRINRLAATSEQVEARLSLRDKVKAIALRRENVGPSESSRMLEDL